MQTNLSRQERIGFIVKHAETSRHFGPLPNADLVINGGGGECGENVKLYFRLNADNRITAASFEAEGTTIGKASASLTTEAIIGQTLNEVIEMDYDVILETLGRDIVSDRLRAATVALDTAKVAARKHLAREA